MTNEEYKNHNCLALGKKRILSWCTNKWGVDLLNKHLNRRGMPIEDHNHNDVRSYTASAFTITSTLSVCIEKLMMRTQGLTIYMACRGAMHSSMWRNGTTITTTAIMSRHSTPNDCNRQHRNSQSNLNISAN